MRDEKNVNFVVVVVVVALVLSPSPRDNPVTRRTAPALIDD